MKSMKSMTIATFCADSVIFVSAMNAYLQTHALYIINIKSNSVRLSAPINSEFGGYIPEEKCKKVHLYAQACVYADAIHAGEDTVKRMNSRIESLLNAGDENGEVPELQEKRDEIRNNTDILRSATEFFRSVNNALTNDEYALCVAIYSDVFPQVWGYIPVAVKNRFSISFGMIQNLPMLTEKAISEGVAKPLRDAINAEFDSIINSVDGYMWKFRVKTSVCAEMQAYGYRGYKFATATNSALRAEWNMSPCEYMTQVFRHVLTDIHKQVFPSEYASRDARGNLIPVCVSIPKPKTKPEVKPETK